MYIVTIHHRGHEEPTDYKIYEKEEMDSQNKRYVYWKEANEGDYALSDDGYCAKVIKKTLYPNNTKNKTIYLRVPWGYIMWNPKYPTKKFKAKGRITPHTFKGKPLFQGFKKREKFRNLAMCYAQTMDKDLSIDLAMGTHTDSEHMNWKKRMNTEEFRSMVREELQALLNSHGKTADYTMQLLGDAIELAKTKKDVSNLMRAVENLQDMHGMKDKALVKTTTQIEAVSTSKMLDEINEEEKRLKATQVVQGVADSNN